MALVPTIVDVIKNRVTVWVYDVQNGNVWRTIFLIYRKVYDSLEHLIILIKKDEEIEYRM